MNYISVCYTHEIPVYSLDGLEVLPVWIGDRSPPSQFLSNFLSVKDSYADLDFYRNYLSGSAGMFAMGRWLQKNNNIKINETSLIQLSYRKIVSNQKIGRDSIEYPSMRIVDADYKIERNIIQPNESGFLIPMPVNIGSLINQYSVSHKLGDLLRYCAVCIDEGILTSAECIEFMNSGILIPGGVELGALPLNHWLSIVNKLSKVSLKFCSLHRPVDDGIYQRRALAFCNERLGSYLLLKELLSIFNNEIPRDIFGHMVTFTPGNEYFPNSN